MHNFSHTLTTSKGVFKLHFSKVEGGNTQKYFVAVEAFSMQVASFDMKRNKEDDWEVVEPAPLCIVEASDKLSSLIKERIKIYSHHI